VAIEQGLPPLGCADARKFQVVSGGTSDAGGSLDRQQLRRVVANFTSGLPTAKERP
jgi:hypothetical protein